VECSAANSDIEALRMKSLFFLLIILAGVAILFWLMRRPSSQEPTDLPRPRRNPDPVSTSADAAVLTTPGNNATADNDEIWEARRKRAHNISAATDGSDSYVEFEDEPEYVGNSRRGRQRLAPAQVKEEQPVDELEMTSIEFESVSRTGQPQT
jgi:hypothetical protein